MRTVSKVSYWIAGFIGTAVWTSSIITLTGLPLPTQLALGGMGLVATIWGHSVLFPKERMVSAATAPGRMSRDEAIRVTQAAGPLPLGTARTLTSRPPRNAPSLLPPPGELPPLLRAPFEEAARMEAHRLAEALTAAGLFGAVNVRLEPNGTAIISPVHANGGVRVPIDRLVRFASYVTLPEGLTTTGEHGAGHWPGTGLLAAMDAHLASVAPPVMAAARPGPRPAGTIRHPQDAWPAPRLVG